MKILLAFDFGLKRIGVAIGNTLIQIAKPLTIINTTKKNSKIVLNQLISNWTPAACVVGIPTYPDGNTHMMTKNCHRFAHQLHKRFNIDIILIDERYSSAIISSRRGVMIDDIAAAIILQQYFDCVKNNDKFFTILQ